MRSNFSAVRGAGQGPALDVLAQVGQKVFLSRFPIEAGTQLLGRPGGVVVEQLLHLTQELAQHLVVALGRGVGFAHPVQLLQGTGLVPMLFLPGHVGNGAVGRLAVGGQAQRHRAQAVLAGRAQYKGTGNSRYEQTRS